MSRFNDHSKSKQKLQEVVTEDKLRVDELIKDLEKHTGVSKDLRPGVRTAKLMN